MSTTLTQFVGNCEQQNLIDLAVPVLSAIANAMPSAEPEIPKNPLLDMLLQALLSAKSKRKDAEAILEALFTKCACT